jgi:hypothetical protein
LLVLLLAAPLIVAGCGSSGSGKGATSSDPKTAITARMNSLIGHINSGDAKAILDNDVPTSARRTCSDKDARATIGALRAQLPAGATFVVQDVRDVQVVGNKATATASIGVTGQVQPQPATLAFVKDGGNWRLDPSGSTGCNGLIPQGVA